VIPRTIRDLLDLEIGPAAGWRGNVPTWFGIPCSIGRVTMWLPVQEQPGQYRDFSLLVLLAREELTDAPPFIHLGAQFLLEYGVEVLLNYRPVPPATSSGQLVIP
jgi:hypothetical protein